MKFIICLAALIAVTIAAPLDDPKDAQVLRYENDNDGIASYKYGYVEYDVLNFH